MAIGDVEHKPVVPVERLFRKALSKELTHLQVPFTVLTVDDCVGANFFDEVLPESFRGEHLPSFRAGQEECRFRSSKDQCPSSKDVYRINRSMLAIHSKKESTGILCHFQSISDERNARVGGIAADQRHGRSLS